MDIGREPPARSCPCNRQDDMTLWRRNEQCFCAAKVLSRPCLSWVKGSGLRMSAIHPLRGREPPSLSDLAMSRKCQFRKLRLALIVIGVGFGFPKESPRPSDKTINAAHREAL